MSVKTLKKTFLVGGLSLALAACGINPADRASDPLNSHPELKNYQTPEQLAQINRLEKKVYALINENLSLPGRIFNFFPGKTSSHLVSAEGLKPDSAEVQMEAQGLPGWVTWEKVEASNATEALWQLSGTPPEDLLDEEQDYMVFFIEILIKRESEEATLQSLTLPLILQRDSDRPRVERLSPFPTNLKESETFHFVVEVIDPAERGLQFPPLVYFFPGEAGFGADFATFLDPQQPKPRRMKNGHWEYHFVLDGPTLGALARGVETEDSRIQAQLRLQAQSSDGELSSLPLKKIFNFELSSESQSSTGGQ